jgi:hypothetical protein
MDYALRLQSVTAQQNTVATFVPAQRDFPYVL